MVVFFHSQSPCLPITIYYLLWAYCKEKKPKKATHFISWEPQGHYRCTKSMATVPFWLSPDNKLVYRFVCTPKQIWGQSYWLCCQSFQYAVKAQTSLAPLSWFPGSHIPTAHVHQCCRFQSYANSHATPYEIYKSVNRIPGIHHNGPPRTTLWRLTLTAYSQSSEIFGGILEEQNVAVF